MSNTCTSCLAPKAALACGLCQAALCKSCALLNEVETFQFLKEVPEQLKHSFYCTTCYEAKVRPAVESYAEILERAKDVNVFYRSQGKESRFIRRTEKPLKVENCDDRDETILRLAFQAAELGFNCLVDVDLDSEKVKNGRWQTSIWHGTGVPATVDPLKLARRFITSPN